jgi:hypothetical protein
LKTATTSRSTALRFARSSHRPYELVGFAEEGKALAASVVTTGVAVSLLPVLIRVLPRLTRDARTSERDADYVVAVVGVAAKVRATINRVHIQRDCSGLWCPLRAGPFVVETNPYSPRREP